MLVKLYFLKHELKRRGMMALLARVEATIKKLEKEGEVLHG